MQSQEVSQKKVRNFSSSRLRLQNAINEFQSELSNDQRLELSHIRERYTARGPDIRDVIQLTTEIDSYCREGRRHQSKYTNLLMETLGKIQDFAGAIDVVAGGMQIPILSGVWGTLRVGLLIVCNRRELLERLADLLMDVGRQCPDYQDLVEYYPNSTDLKDRLCDYLIAVVNLCQRAVTLTKKWSWSSYLRDYDSTFRRLELDLQSSGEHIKSGLELCRLENQRSQLHAVAEHKAKKRQREGIEAFLHACTDYSPESSFRRYVTKGRSEWAQNLQHYRDFTKSPKFGVLWCEGKLGFGKSVIAANIVQSLMSKDLSVGYFFCNFDETRSKQAGTIIGSLTKQLLKPSLKSTKDLNYDKGEHLDTEKLSDILKRLLPNTETGYYLVIDGLDQCSKEDVWEVVQWIKKLRFFPQVFRIYISARSSMLNTEKSQLQPLTLIEVPDDRDEIGQYVDRVLEERLMSGRLTIGRRSLLPRIRDKLVKESSGMFLWITLQIDSLCEQLTDDDRLHCLESLPKTLRETYDQIIYRLSKKENVRHKHATFCHKTFSIIASASRPLILDELRDALAVQPGDRELNEQDLITDVPKAIEQLGSLVTYDAVSMTVRFAHHTILEHVLSPTDDELLREYRIERQKSEILLGEICIAYLCFPRFGMRVEKYQSRKDQIDVQHFPQLAKQVAHAQDSSLSNAIVKFAYMWKGKERAQDKLTWDFSSLRERQPDEAITRSYPFFEYASENWLSHSKQFDEVQAVPMSQWRKLLDGEVPRIKLPWAPEKWSDFDPGFQQWIFRNSHDGLLLLMFRELLNDLLVIYSKRRYYALGMAYTFLRKLQSDENHRTVVARPYFGLLLHALSYDTNTCDLWCPDGSSYSPIAFLKALLETTAIQVNQKEGHLGCALQAASSFGSIEAVDILLQYGCDVNIVCGYLGTALQAAIDRSRYDIIERLLNAGANVNVEGGAYHSPLQTAANIGVLEIVELMVNSGAEVNATGGFHGTALQASAGSEHLDVVEYLLSLSADPNIVGGLAGTALNAAIIYEPKQGIKRRAIVRCLMDSGADVRLQGGPYGDALQTAAAKGNIDLANYLLDHKKANINVTGKEYLTPLATAAQYGSDEMVELLLQRGADANRQGGKWGNDNPLKMAVSRDSQSKVELLLRYGAEINREDSRGQPLHVAAQRGNEAIVRLLLGHGGDANAIDKGLSSSPKLVNEGSPAYFATALQAACRMGHKRIVELLVVEHDADVNAQGGIWISAFLAAVAGHHKGIAWFLSDYIPEGELRLQEEADWYPIREYVVRRLS